MPPPDWLQLHVRPLPSANIVVLRGRRPILVDTGSGADVAETERLLRDSALAPAELALVVNTHHHSDHTGGNHRLQTIHGRPVAAAAIEAELVNRRDPAACDAVYLDQPIEPYHVDRPLDEGDVLDTGERQLEVWHLPGHSPGNLAFYEPTERILIAGDVVHATDVAWVDVARGGTRAIETARSSVERLSKIPVAWACSGHGPPMEDPPAAFAAALRRYDTWLDDPGRAAWHACKRILAFRLMLTSGINRAALADYLLGCPWFVAYSRHAFDSEPREFVAPLLEEMLRSRAAYWEGDRLLARTAHTRPALNWMQGIPWPADWKPVEPS